MYQVSQWRDLAQQTEQVHHSTPREQLLNALPTWAKDTFEPFGFAPKAALRSGPRPSTHSQESIRAPGHQLIPRSRSGVSTTRRYTHVAAPALGLGVPPWDVPPTSSQGVPAMELSTHVVAPVFGFASRAAPVFGFASRAAPLSKPKIRVSVGRFASWASYWINLHGTQAKRYHKPCPAGPVNRTRPAEDVCQCLSKNRSWALSQQMRGGQYKRDQQIELLLRTCQPTHRSVPLTKTQICEF